MAYTTPSTQATGTLITSTMYKAHIIDNIKFLHGPPTARATRDATQSITDNTWTAVQFDVEDWDTNTIWSSTSNTKFFCRTAGKYLVNFTGGFANSSAGTYRAIAIQLNTTTAGNGHEAMHMIGTTAITLGAGQGLSVSQLVSMTTGQYVRGEAFQLSGGSLNTSTSGSGSTPPMRLSIIWMSS